MKFLRRPREAAQPGYCRKIFQLSKIHFFLLLWLGWVGQVHAAAPPFGLPMTGAGGGHPRPFLKIIPHYIRPPLAFWTFLPVILCLSFRRPSAAFPPALAPSLRRPSAAFLPALAPSLRRPSAVLPLSLRRPSAAFLPVPPPSLRRPSTVLPPSLHRPSACPSVVLPSSFRRLSAVFTPSQPPGPQSAPPGRCNVPDA